MPNWPVVPAIARESRNFPEGEPLAPRNRSVAREVAELVGDVLRVVRAVQLPGELVGREVGAARDACEEFSVDRVDVGTKQAQ